ncbi:MAG: hypothetical protein PHH54_02335 [Candidatus Nanoarchaeia archaeon]|nr:hypothetical protein [Candidatus Nanoarchaeia archaeon]MDD5740800.1 hypothetical protein [Candidatus Nanoarchaeia archaeon]
MASLTLSVPEDFKNNLKNLLWINWSEIAREETIKKLIFENYIKTGGITDEEWEFCKKIDWHPVDELPLKEEFIKKLNETKKGRFKKYNSVEEFFAKIK